MKLLSIDEDVVKVEGVGRGVGWGVGGGGGGGGWRVSRKASSSRFDVRLSVRLADGRGLTEFVELSATFREKRLSGDYSCVEGTR